MLDHLYNNSNQEQQLLQDFKAGEETAFAQLYQLHIQALLSYGQKITADRSLLFLACRSSYT